MQGLGTPEWRLECFRKNETKEEAERRATAKKDLAGSIPNPVTYVGCQGTMFGWSVTGGWPVSNGLCLSAEGPGHRGTNRAGCCGRSAAEQVGLMGPEDDDE